MSSSGSICGAASSTLVSALILAAGSIRVHAQGVSASDEDAAIVAFILLGVFVPLLVACYYIPSFVAFVRGHPNRWLILLINTVFGATGLGWFGALIWACNAAHRPESGSYGGESGLNLFVNDVQRTASLGSYQATLPVDELRRLKMLLDQGAIDQHEYDCLKAQTLSGVRR